MAGPGTQHTTMNENSSQPILNPNVYLNYLQPTDASEYEVARDLFLVTFGALLWDILSSLPEDWTIIRTTTPSPVLFAYFASRTCALAVVFMSVLAKTGPVPNCGVLELVLFIFWVLASASSSYLFLKRVHAVFPQERLVCHAFTVLWIVGVSASVVVVLPGSLHVYYEIADTKHCMNAQIKSYVSAAFIGTRPLRLPCIHCDQLQDPQVPSDYKTNRLEVFLPCQAVSSSYFTGSSTGWTAILHDHKWLQRHGLGLDFIAQYFSGLSVIAFCPRGGNHERDGVSRLSESQVRGVAEDRSCKSDRNPICGQRTCQCSSAKKQRR
ncbi:hypothetical protein JVT61DRAFT_5620 [Boletus reticuloceps]|uniref:Uncharacterized protein n=1 Tax=Boletus reticuloceps TaxID=495285 RepID=A0A8I2Z2L9_9AGAM|nr:hypothetical protein JVT61DRAFT_5620 [Boletus reticuloceps]